ncbi:unnamed protein product [Allacma fusca]|uniref:C2H2-type domain-containing protein n=1 Tax=Allacma fusca TaxID=39272 RepID=A0A8J2NSC4_9HEXA|nr:unnamed protein product [Allacma fusca]
MQSLQLLVKTWIAEKITQEEKLIATELAAIDTTGSDYHVVHEIKFAYDMVVQNPAKIIFNDHIVMNKALILGVFSQVITYLIVLMQFSQNKSMDELEMKLESQKETIFKLLTLQYKIDLDNEVRVFKKFSPTEFRERIQERFGIPPQFVGKSELMSDFELTVLSPSNSPDMLDVKFDAGQHPDEQIIVNEGDRESPVDVDTEVKTRSATKGTSNGPVTKKKAKRKVATKTSKLRSKNSGKLASSNPVIIEVRKSAENINEEQRLSVFKKKSDRLTKQAENDSKLVVKCTFFDPVKGPCRYRFINEEKMDIHIKRHHLNLPKNEMYQCPHCPRTASCESKLELHLKLHTGKTDLPCEICGTLFRTEYLLTKHKVKVHGVSYPFICQQCHEGFINKADLNYHSYSHTGDWPYPCDECNAGFPSKARLDRHKQHNHYELKILNFACKVCNKKFQSLGVLNRHEKCHEAERPFKCNICSWSFKFNSLLKTHMISVHSDDRPFLCQECGASFKLNKQLLVHLRGHDGRKRPFLKRLRRLKPPGPVTQQPVTPAPVKSVIPKIPQYKASVSISSSTSGQAGSVLTRRSVTEGEAVAGDLIGSRSKLTSDTIIKCLLKNQYIFDIEGFWKPEGFAKTAMELKQRIQKVVGIEPEDVICNCEELQNGFFCQLTTVDVDITK